MAKFILAKFEETPLDHLSNSEINVFLNRANISRDFDPSKELTNSEKKNLLRTFGDCPLTTPLHYISLKQALDMMEAFDENPNSFTISRGAFDDFDSLLKKLIADHHIPHDNELGLRFYFGFNASNEYNIVVVPMYGLSPLNLNPSSHVEKTLLDKAGFFALVPSLNRILKNKIDCGQLIASVDGTGIRLAYFSYNDFSDFTNELVKQNFQELRFSFARCSDKLTIISTGFDGNGNPIIFNTGKSVVGICFDQGDLMPPPPVSDSSF